MTMESNGRTSTLRHSFEIQKRVIAALFFIELLTRYGRHNIGFLWLFVEPMIFTLGITAFWTYTKPFHGSNLPIVAFAITGYSTVLLWRNMPNRVVGSIQPNLSLMHHRNVRVLDIFLSRMLLEAVGVTTSFVTLSCIFIAMEWMLPPEDILKVTTGWILLTWFGMALGLFIGALSEVSEIVDKLWHPLTYLLFPLSGAAFLVDALPKSAQDFILMFPMVHATELIRDGYFGSKISAHYDYVYLVAISSVLTAIGLAVTLHVGRRIIPE